MKIAVDAGHGWVKALADNGKRVLFPSLICPPPPAADLGEYGPSQPVRINGEAYLVGEVARNHATPLWTRDKAQDPDTLRLIVVAAAELGAVGPVTLATGLPLSWFGAQRKAFRDALMASDARVQLPGRADQRIWIEQVKVLPQGVAAASGVIVDPALDPGEYLVVDIGYRTSDFVIVAKSDAAAIRFDPTHAGSLEIGTHAVAAAIAHGLERDYRIPFRPAEVEAADQVYVEGQRVALAGRRAEAVRTVGAHLREGLAETLDQRLHKIAGWLLVGGGAAMMAPVFPQAMVLDDAHWANVRAYLGTLV